MSFSPNNRPAVVIVGAGLVGLSVARRLAQRGWAVTVVERSAAGGEATSAAAGMLVPSLEFEPGSAALRLGLEAKEYHRSYAAALAEETGQDVDLRLGGVLAVAAVEGDEPWTPPAGELVSGSEVARLEPGLSTGVVDRAWHVAQEGSVDARALARATLSACLKLGVKLLQGTAALEVCVRGDRVTAVRTDAGELKAEVAVNCAGAWASTLRVPGVELRIRPIKGQMLLLDTSNAARRPLERVIYSHLTYLVPRSDGRLVVGTTVEDRGFDKTVEAGAVAGLVDRAARLCPALGRARLVETWAGLRPLGEARLPEIGPRGPSGYFVGVGHYRNGILLGPLTAERLAGQICGDT